MKAYFEISNVNKISVGHEGNDMAITFESNGEIVQVVLTEQQMKDVHNKVLNYMPGMPGNNKFHEDRLNSNGK